MRSLLCNEKSSPLFPVVPFRTAALTENRIVGLLYSGGPNVVAADEPSRHAQESLQGISFGVDGYDVLRVTEEVGEALKQGPWFKNEGGRPFLAG